MPLWQETWPRFLRGAVWALATPAVLSLCRRFPLRRVRERGTLAAHLVGAALIPAAVLVCHFVALNLAAGDPIWRWSLWVLDFPPSLRALGHTTFLTYLGLLAVIWGLDAHREAQREEVEAQQLKARLAGARLMALKMQLHPHFLFNTLNTLLPLIFRDADSAARTIVQLGDLVRFSQRNGESPFVTLRDELAFLDRYLQIEETRFQDRLTVERDVDAQVLSASVPNLILQPLVENAIKHGITARPGPGRLEIRACRSGRTLVLEVQDDGVGLPAAVRAGRRQGVGLENTRGRLEQLYGSSHRFELVNRPSGGVVARIEIPLVEFGTGTAPAAKGATA